MEPRIIAHPAFWVAGQKTWISGQDNSLFGNFWAECREDGLFSVFERITHFQPGTQTNAVTLGISRVEADPSKRTFYYMIAVEVNSPQDDPSLESCEVPACTWAVFPCHGHMPEALVKSEMYAFMEWLPSSGYRHALAPEMEVYPPQADQNQYMEFWLPIEPAT